MADYKYSVVVPLFKSAAQLPALIDFIRFSFVENPASVQLVFVVDGCTQQYKFDDLSFFSNTRIVYLNQNYGQYTATLCGLAVADAAWVITMDADMYHQPGLFSGTLLYAGTSELVYADFTYRSRGIVRMLGSLVYNGIIKVATGKYYRHTGSSFRIIERELKNKLLSRISYPAALDIWLMKLAGGIHFIELEPVIHAPSSYSFPKLIGAFYKLCASVVAMPFKKLTPFPHHKYIAQLIENNN